MDSNQINLSFNDQSRFSKGLNKVYAFSIKGSLRLASIISLIGGFIAASCAIKDSDFASLYEDHLETRVAYLFFSITGCIFLSVEYLIYLLNVLNAGLIKKLRAFIEILFFINDIICLLSIFGVSIACAVRENELADEKNNYEAFNEGAFAAAAALGFLACFGLAALVSLNIYEYKNTKSQSSQMVTNNTQIL